tara:strand:- start:293 stop:1003 length:711 start_codon:yes stop_codon:yes gene_type:complete
MSERIEGLFLRSTMIKNNAVIVDVLTQKYGRCSFLFPNTSKKKSGFLFQPFHFIEFSSKFNYEKKINLASKVELVFSVINIISDIRKTGYALLVTEVLTKVIQQQEENISLYSATKEIISQFETQPFNPVFGVFFIKLLINQFGIQPINNYSKKTPHFNPKEGKFCEEKDGDMDLLFPNKEFSEILGTKIDYDSNYKLSSPNRRRIMDLLLFYMQYHGLINTEKIKSIQILQSLYD